LRLLPLSFALALAACAQTPTQGPAAGAAADSSAAPAPAATAATAAPAAKPAEQVAATGAQGATEAAGGAAARTATPTGYHVIEKNGQKFYCTDTPAMGTRIKSRTSCMSQEQFERSRQEAQDKMREKQGQRQTWE
jgi:hypothetical protein